MLCCDVLCCFVVPSQANHVPQIYKYVYDNGASTYAIIYITAHGQHDGQVLKRLNTNNRTTPR